MSILETEKGHWVGMPVATAMPVVDFEYEVVANEYGFYCVPDAFKGREVPEILAGGGVYEPATLSLMARILRRGGDVITGGTFIGDFLPALSEALVPDARVHTFEPNPVARNAAMLTAWLNGLVNIDMHGCAIGEETGKLHLQVAKANGTSMAARAKVVEQATEGETIEIDVQTLDALVGVERPIAIVHLDVEGHEWPALWGARDIIATYAPCIIVEAEKGWKRRKIETSLMELFPDAGYHRAGCIERNVIYVPKHPKGPFRGT